MDKCYKIHGYPPGYKSKGKSYSANQVAFSPTCYANGMEELTTIALTSSQCQQLMTMLQSHALGSHQPSLESSLGTHQAATLITQPSKPSQLSGSFNTAGIVFMTKDKDFDKVDYLCLHTSITLEHSVFSSNLVVPSDIFPQDWIIDSATDHMLHSISLLTKITLIVHISIKLPNGESVLLLVTHIGQVQLSTDLVLDNVLCVPSFSFNLISIGKLTHHLRCCCIFLSNFCFIQDLVQWKTIELSRKHGGMGVCTFYSNPILISFLYHFNSPLSCLLSCLILVSTLDAGQPEQN